MKKLARGLLYFVFLCCSLNGISQTLPGDSIVFGPMLSPVYDDTVRVWVLTKDSTNTGDSLAIELTGAGSPNTPLTGTVYNSDSRLGYHLRSYKYGGLTTGETYTAVIKKNNVAMYRSASVVNGADQFGDFSFLAGGCGRIYDTTRCIDIPEATSGSHINGTPEIYNQMATENSDMMIWLGDATYLLGLQHANGQCPNGVDDWANKDMAFDRYMFYRQFHDSLIRAMPQLSITDNHDTGPNEFNYDMPTMGEMREIFMDWWPNPEYLSTQAGQGMFSSYKYKDVEFFLTDNRSYRTGTLAHFGAEQQTWLKQALLNSTATFKVIISGTPVFNTNWGGRNYSYSSQGADLRQYIQDNNIDGVIAFSADIHQQQFYGSYQYKYPLYDVLSGNLNSDVGNSQSYSVNYTSNAIMGGVKQTYVKVSLEGDASDRRMKIAYTDTAGVPYFTSIVHSEMLTSIDDSVKHVDLGFLASTYDSSSYHHALSATGLSYVEDRNQDSAAAAYFNSSTNVQVPYQQSWNMNNRAFSISYWAKPAQFGSKSAVFSTGSTTNGFTIGFDEDGYPEYTDHATGNTFTSSRSLLTNKWSHLTWIYDNVKRHLELYFNGMMIESWEGVISPEESTSNIYIGQASQGQHYTGALDEVNVYGKLISTETIQLEAEIETEGSVLSLSGSQNMAIPGATVNSLLTGDFTIEFWGKLSSDPCTNCKILSSNGRDGNNNTTGLSFEFNSSNQLSAVNGTGSSGWSSISNAGNSWNIGEWNHVAYTAEQNGTMKLYINGELVGNGSYSSFVNNSWGFGFGYSPYYSGSVNAELDEFRIWTSALSQDTIQSRMHHTLSGNEANLGMYYDFSEYTDSTIMSSGSATYEMLLDGASLANATSPVATIDSAFLNEVVGNWSIELNDNNGLELLNSINDYITNMVIGRSVDSTFAVYDAANNQYYSKTGWQIAQNNLPFANLRINLDLAIPQSDSIQAIASNYFLLEEDTAGNFSIVSNGSYDGQNVNFYNAYIEGGYYYLGFEVDSSGNIGRGGVLALNNNHNVVLPNAVIDSVFSEPFTIETWFRVNANPQDKKMISCHGKINNLSKGFTFEMPNNTSMTPNVVFGTNTSSWNAASANAAINIGEWNHMAVTVVPNDSFRIYINGELTNTKDFDTYIPSGTWDLAFGKSQNYGNGVLTDFDEFRIYGRVLTQQEIKDGMHLSMDDADPTLVYNLTFDQNDNGYLQNTSSVLPDSIAYTNASIVGATTPVSEIDATYRNTVRGSWSVDANSDNGLYVSNNINSYTSNLVAGRVFNDATVALPSTNDTFYVEGAWLVNTMEMDSADISINLQTALTNADSIDLYATEYYLLFGDPQSNYTILGADTAVNGVVEFDDVPVEFGTYYLAFVSDEQNVINQQGGVLTLLNNHEVTIPKDDVNQVMTSANGFTLEVWAKLNSTAGANRKLIGFSNYDGSNYGWEFEFLGNQTLQTITGNNGWNTNNSSHVWNVGEWNHAAVTFMPNGYFKFYINGEIQDSLAVTNFIANVNDLALGKNIWNDSPVDADMDEFRIWNRVKTAEEIKAEMYRELPAGYDTTLKINYSFNESVGGYAYNKGDLNLGDSILLYNADVLPATDPVRLVNAPYDNTVSGNWSVMNDNFGGFYLENTISGYSSNVVVGRDLNNTINQFVAQDSFYIAGGWSLDLLNYNNEMNNVLVDLNSVLNDPDSITTISSTFFLIKGNPATSNYSFVKQGAPIGDIVYFDSVMIDSGLYTIAWTPDTGLVPIIANFPVVSSNDDAEQDISSGSMYLTSTDLELTTDGSSDQIIGMRFNNVTIPQGAVINNAYIQFNVDEVTNTGVADAIIAVEDIAYPLEITSFDFDLYHRLPYYGDTVIWNIPAFNTVDEAGLDQRTPDLTQFVEHVIAKSTWQSGNPIVFMMADPYQLGISGYAGNTGVRTVSSYESAPSKAPQLVINYSLPDIYYNGTFPIASGGSWKFDTTYTSLDSTNWTAVNYNDSTWNFGDAILGYGNNNESTELDFGNDSLNKYPTYYLRHIFNVDDATLYDSLKFNVLRDGGVVVYVNGTEAFRQNMPTGTVGYDTMATTAVTGNDETTYFQTTTPALLQNGTNVIAVELHQSSVNNSDLSFDMYVDFTEPPLGPASYPMAENSEWFYYDEGVSLDTVSNWKDTSFVDTWNSGEAPLGYGDPVTTTLSYGNDASNKYITTYFRRSITIDTAAVGDTVLLGLRRDDGAVVYINGTEVARSNMPTGTITYNSNASNAVSGNDETDFFTYLFPKSVFHQGENQIAVELHQANATSSDLVFDMYLEDAPVINPPAMGCSGGNGDHIACFTSIVPTSQTANLLIPNSSHRFQLLYKEGDQYTDGSGSVPGNHDFTAYLPINGSSTLGHLSVNHENTPGGVSMLDIHYDDTNRLWVVDTSKAVDFYNNDLVTTTRNCSGGITPWGTVVTAEETMNSGDQNNDGYQDVGWLVEIDPFTASVVDYQNDGVQDKLWAMGRMNHENVVITADSTTAYYGEDGGTHCVYKYVMDTPGNLSSGTVYVLSLDQPLSNNDPTGTTASWIQVPNTTQSDRNSLNTVASSVGGTSFNGIEDVEISPVDGMVYFTAKGLNRVYRFTDNGNFAGDFETFVGGTSYTLNTEAGVVTEAWGGGNDNLTFDDQGNLWVLQDGGNNYIWLVRPDHSQAAPKVELFASMPSGSEPTGLTFTPDYKFGFFSVQHPSGSNGSQLDATFNNVTFNASASVVFSRTPWLGAQTPEAGFMADTTVVIVGNTVTYVDTSLNNPTSLQWTFNGGSPTTSTAATVAVTYNTVGTYTTKLVAANPAGSDTAEYVQYIQVIEPAPVADFTAQDTLFIQGDSTVFTDLSTNNPDSVLWTFNGGSPATSTDTMPTVTYNNYGYYDVTLVAYNQAGSDTITKSMYIHVIEPAPDADFEADTTIVVAGDSTFFTDLSTHHPDSLFWIFGGGNPVTSTDTMPYVTYNATGFYDVTLMAYNQAGSDIETKVQYIEVIDPAPVVDFVANDTLIIEGNSTIFTDLSTNNPDSVRWTFAGGSPATSTNVAPSVTYTNSGYYDVTLTAYNQAGSDTLTKLMYIHVIEPAPVADFEADTTVVVAGDSTFFTDLSSNHPDSLFWVFAGGSPAISSDTMPYVTYNTPGFYSVSLNAYNQAGVGSETKVDYIQVIAPAPQVNFIANATVVVAGDSVTFTDLSTNNPDSLAWEFAGGTPTTSNDTAPKIAYDVPGVYNVTLAAFNAAGGDTLTKVTYITVLDPVPVAGFIADETSIFTGDSVTFTDLSTNNPTAWSWVFSGGSPATSSDSMPVVQYNTPGLYDVTLISSNQAGSSSPEVWTSYIEVNERTGIEENLSNGVAISWYPNPTSGSIVLTLNATGGENITVELYDITARKIASLLSDNAASGEQQWTFNLNNYVSNTQTLIMVVAVDGETSKHIIQFVE